MESSGIMCPVRTVGKPAILTLHWWVDNTSPPSTRATFRGKCDILLLVTGVPSMMKIWVAPESAMASFVLRAKVAPAKLASLVEDNVLDVTIVTSSSSRGIFAMVDLVGYDKVAELT